MSNSFSQQYTRIGICSDTHYWPDTVNNILPTGELQLQHHSKLLQRTLLAELEKANLDVVVHLGDLTCGGGSFGMPHEDFLRALHETHRGFNSLSASVHALPGNHDCLPGGSDWHLFEELWSLDSGQGRTVDTPHARLILINAQGHSTEQIDPALPHDPVYGWVNEAELARIETDLATAGGRPVIVFIHQVLRPWIGAQEWQDFYGVMNAQEVLSILEKHSSVRAVFQGHAHRLDVQTVYARNAPCLYTVVPAIVEYPVSWVQLTLDHKHLEITTKALPLPDLSKQSLQSGAGQRWRAGEAEWQNFTIPLAETDCVG